MKTSQFSELAEKECGFGIIGGSMGMDTQSIGVAIVVAGMFALLGIWLYRLGKKEE